jgi:hypothetical protein
MCNTYIQPSPSLPTAGLIEQRGAAVTQSSCNRELFSENLSRPPTAPTEELRRCPRSIQINVAIVSGSDHDRFVPNPFQVAIYHSSQHTTLYSLKSRQRQSWKLSRSLLWKQIVPDVNHAKLNNVMLHCRKKSRHFQVTLHWQAVWTTWTKNQVDICLQINFSFLNSYD